MVFVELKRLSDVRLHSGEVNKQIAKYIAFAHDHNDEIIKAYRNAIQVKALLGILPKTSELATATIKRVEPKPILAVACSNQKYIDDWKHDIEKKLNTEQLAGLYFFGATVDLNSRPPKTRQCLSSASPGRMFTHHRADDIRSTVSLDIKEAICPNRERR